jgi:tetratricopeptide (TPR) repeat protein
LRLFGMPFIQEVPVSLDEFPTRDSNSELAAVAESWFERVIVDAGLFVVQSRDRRDYGTDFQIEAKQSGGMTNYRVHVQLKGTEKPANRDGSVSVSIDRMNLNYMLSQPHSIYVCYHAPTRQLLVRSADEVYPDAEHRAENWPSQGTVTVRFRDPFDADYQAELHGRTVAGSKFRRDDRLHWVITPPEDYHREVESHVPSIHVPESSDEASSVLQSLHEQGYDDVISKAFPQFVACVGEDDPRLIFAYLSEINLAMRRASFDRDRVRRGITFIETVRPDNGPDALYCRANGFSALGKRDEAKRLYRLAIEKFGGRSPEIEARCWKNLGTECEAEGNRAEARRCYEQAVVLFPPLMEAHMALGMAERAAGNLESALEHFDHVVWSVGDISSTLAARGHRLEVYFRLEMADKAFDDIAVLLPHGDRHPWILPWCARLVFNYARTSGAAIVRAIRFWDAYLRMAPHDSAARRERLLCLAHAKMHGQPANVGFAQYMQQVTAYLADDPTGDVAHLWDRIGHWAQIDGDWGQAEHYYRKAYDLEPDRYGYCLGVALNYLKRFDESLPLLVAQATTHQPDALSWFQVAIAREGTGDIDGCKEAYQRALELDPYYAAAMFNLGGILWNHGAKHEAVRVWSESLGRFPTDPLSIRLRREFSPLFGDDEDEEE